MVGWIRPERTSRPARASPSGTGLGSRPVPDLTTVPFNPDSIRALMRSDRMRVAPEELDLIFRLLGGRGSLPVVERSP